MTKKIKNKTKNIPKLRFEGFSGEWSNIKFSDLFDFGSTNSISRDGLNYEKGDYLNIHYGDIHTKFKSHFFVEKESVPFVNKENENNIEENLVRAGDLVIADASEDYNDIGKAIEVISINNKKVISGLHTIHAKNKRNDLASGFIGHCFRNYKTRLSIKRISQGVKVLGLSKKYLKDLNLIIPDEDEQKKIADFLCSIDEWIDNLREQKEFLLDYKKGMMQRFFPKKGESVPEVRFGGFSGEWKKIRLGKLCDITTGALDANAMVENGEYRFYTCAKDFYKINNYDFDTEALLISGNGANVGYVHYYKGKFNAYQRTYILDHFSCHIFYIKYFLDKFLKFRINKEKKEGNTPYIVMGTLTEMEIILPCLDEQKKIAAFLSSISYLIDKKQEQIARAEAWKKGIMQGLFV